MLLFFYISASLDEGSSGASVLSGQVQTYFLQSKYTVFHDCPIFPRLSLFKAASLEDAENNLYRNCLCSQPSSSCSFDGCLKTDQSDSEPKWPEIPPVLNQNEERRRNKYLRKDYLKV